MGCGVSTTSRTAVAHRYRQEAEKKLQQQRDRIRRGASSGDDGAGGGLDADDASDSDSLSVSSGETDATPPKSEHRGTISTMLDGENKDYNQRNFRILVETRRFQMITEGEQGNKFYAHNEARGVFNYVSQLTMEALLVHRRHMGQSESSQTYDRHQKRRELVAKINDWIDDVIFQMHWGETSVPNANAMVALSSRSGTASGPTTSVPQTTGSTSRSPRAAMAMGVPFQGMQVSQQALQSGESDRPVTSHQNSTQSLPYSSRRSSEAGNAIPSASTALVNHAASRSQELQGASSSSSCLPGTQQLPSQPPQFLPTIRQTQLPQPLQTHILAQSSQLSQPQPQPQSQPQLQSQAQLQSQSQPQPQPHTSSMFSHQTRPSAEFPVMQSNNSPWPQYSSTEQQPQPHYMQTTTTTTTSTSVPNTGASSPAAFPNGMSPFPGHRTPPRS